MSKSARFEMRMDPETLAAVEVAAVKAGVSRATWIEQAILSRLEAERPRKTKKGER